MTFRTQETELLDVIVVAVERARKVSVDEIRGMQDTILNLRIDWEELQSRLRSRKIDGFEPIVDAMIQLAATALAMSATLQAKIVNQRLAQLDGEKDDDRKDKRKGSRTRW
jgi:hypothetical protein